MLCFLATLSHRIVCAFNRPAVAGAVLQTPPSLSGSRLDIITDQELCKSDLEIFFGKIFNANDFYFYAD